MTFTTNGRKGSLYVSNRPDHFINTNILFAIQLNLLNSVQGPETEARVLEVRVIEDQLYYTICIGGDVILPL